MDEERNYIAFISYRHLPLSKKIAKKIHGDIEHYRVPKELRKKGFGERLGRVFRDEEELTASDDLGSEITNALDHSKFLLVVCESGTKDSMWVDREVQYFISKHDREHVIAILAEGTPEKSFPLPLTEIYNEDGTLQGKVEPLAANLTGIDHKHVYSRFGREKYRIFSALLGVPFDSLWQRERRYQIRRRVLLAAFAFTLVFAFAANTWIKNREISKRNEQIEQQNAQILERNEQILQQNEEIRAQYDALDIREGQLLLYEGERFADTGDMPGAVRNALEAVNNENRKDALGSDASMLLSRALGVGEYRNTMRTDVVLELPATIQEAYFSNDGQLIIVYDVAGYYRAYRACDGTQLWERRFESARNTCMADEAGILFVENTEEIEAISMEDGSTLWIEKVAVGNEEIITYKSLIPVLDVAAGGKYLMCVAYDKDVEMYRLLYRDSQTGEIRKAVDLEDAEGLGSYFDISAETVSEDGSIAAVCLESMEGGYKVYVCDMENEVPVRVFDMPCEIIYRAVYEDKGDHFFLLYRGDDSDEICLQEFLSDGSEGNLTVVPYDGSPVKGIWDTRISTENDGMLIFASAGNVFYVFSGTDGRNLISVTMSEGSVAGWCLLNNMDYHYIILDSEGNYKANFGIYGVESGKFTDGAGYAGMLVSDDFARNKTGYGFYLDPNAAGIAMKSGEPRKLYIMHPCVDENMQQVDWTDDMDRNEATGLYRMTDGSFLYSEMHKNDDEDYETILRIVDPVTSEIKEEYTFEGDLAKQLVYAEDLCISDDGQYLIYTDYLHVVSLNLRTGESENIFGDGWGKRAYGKLADGRIVTSIGSTAQINDQIWSIPFRISIDNGAEQEITGLDFAEYPEYEPYILPAGYLVFAVDERNTMAGSYSIYSIDSKEITSIPMTGEMVPESSLVCGSSAAIFAALEEDGYYRIYDVSTGKVKTEIPIDPEDVAVAGFDETDRYFVVVTADNRIRVFSSEDGTLLFECVMENSDSMRTDSDIMVTLSADESRMYIILKKNGKIGDNGILTCLETEDWHRSFSMTDVFLYYPETDEIYKNIPYNMQTSQGVSGILRFTIPDLDELISLGEEYLSEMQ